MNPILEVEALRKHFRSRGGVVRAVDGVDLQLLPGETLGLVGESGCGKSTVARLILHLLAADGGRILLEGREVAAGDMQRFRRRVQIVFQDPFRSLNARRTAGAAIAEPLLIHGLASRDTVRQEVARLLREVGLDPAGMDRYPHEFSGGQRQRVGIARALAVQPEVLVLDEPVSALDVSVQAQIVHLLLQLQRQRSLSYLFISHNLGVVRHIANRVAVMYLGKIVETAPVAQFYGNPRHPYSAALLDAVPELERREALLPELRSDPPDPIAIPPGCRFHPRCQLARQVAAGSGAAPGSVPPSCAGEEPALREIAERHLAACHYAELMHPDAALAAAGQTR